jgi:hypothetical protein
MHMLDRKWILNESKKLGLPACGKSELLARKITIIKTDPKLWTREDFEIILPHLSIHQDLRVDGIDRVESIMSDGLNHGMVDNLMNMVTGKYWTFGQNLRGSPAYIFANGALKYQSKSSPYLSAGNKPLFAIFPRERGDDVFSTINSTAKINCY